jgi:hypothetical protein
MVARHAGIAALLAATLVGACSASHFPSGSLDPGSPDLDGFRSDWYSNHLRAMSEPVLTPREDGRRTYRFTWLRTFHHPIAVRIDATSERATLTAVELDGAGGYDPGQILRRTEFVLDPTAIAQMEAILEQHNFWSLPTSEEAFGLDGAEWIIEAAADKYHVVVRWSPEDGPVRAIGDHFLSLANWEIPPDDVY